MKYCPYIYLFFQFLIDTVIINMNNGHKNYFKDRSSKIKCQTYGVLDYYPYFYSFRAVYFNNNYAICFALCFDLTIKPIPVIEQIREAFYGGNIKITTKSRFKKFISLLLSVCL